jgi:hypothetical protein
MTNLIIEYNASVSTPAGWRSVSMTATALQISPKRVEVIEVTKIDGEIVSKNMSRGGAKRQQYDGQYFSGQEAGKKKNISSLTVI